MINYTSIDEEGYPLFGELRTQDQAIGLEFLQNLSFAPNGAMQTTIQGKTLFVEVFDEPLVIQMVDWVHNQLQLTGLYNYQATADLKTLCVDEWDRFHGKTLTGIPFVLTRKAQAKLFDLLDSYDDESITLNGQTITVDNWLKNNPDIETADYWSNVYRNESPRWELNQPAPALQTMLPKLKLPKSRVLVLGSGSGEDAAFFAQAGHIVTAVDFSEEALAKAKNKFSHIPNLTFVQENIFTFAQKHPQQFDVVFEHTCYCAVNPSRRNELVQLWKKVLIPQGHLLAILFTMEKRQGPPWGGSEWEIRERLKKDFHFLFWGRWRQSIDRREGRELFIYAQKK